MARRTTLWRLDTCSCVIEYEWDDEVPQEERVQSPIQRLSCKHHYHISNIKDHYDAVKLENDFKNLVVGKICEDHGVSDLDVVWSFDKGRKLQIDHAALKLKASDIDDAKASVEALMK